MIDLRHGDCLEIMPTIPDGSIDMVMTDPPYGTTACKWDSVIPLEPMWAQLKRIIKPNGAIVMTASQPFTTTLIASNMKMFKYCWVWEKANFSNQMLAKYQPLKIHEDVCVFSRETHVYNPQGLIKVNKTVKQGNKISENVGGGQRESHHVQEFTNYPRTIQRFNYDSSKIHPTQKPVELLSYLIATYTNPGETVLDFTMGSGSTGIAAINQSCDFIGIEIDEKYFKLAENRINQHSAQGGLF